MSRAASSQQSCSPLSLKAADLDQRTTFASLRHGDSQEQPSLCICGGVSPPLCAVGASGPVRECLGPEVPADHARKQSLRGKPCISNVPGVPRGLLCLVWRVVCLWSCMSWELCWGKRGQKCIPAGQRVPCTQFSV